MSAADKVHGEARLLELLQGHRRAGRRIVLTNGAFDLLHVGHVRSLEEAATLGGVLVVAVNSDRAVRASKGPGRPVVPERERAELLAALGCVDHVLVFDDPTVDRLLEVLRPDVHAKGRDYTLDTLPERETARRLGIEMAIVGDAKQHASSAVVARAAGALEAQDALVQASLGGLHGLATRAGLRALAQAGGWEAAGLLEAGRAAPGCAQRLQVGGQPAFLTCWAPRRRRDDPLEAMQQLLALRAAGLRAPEPWLALDGKQDGERVGLLLVREARGLPLDQHLALHLPGAGPRQRAAMARGLGSALKALHTARFLLPDLSASRLLVDGALEGGPRALVFVAPQGLARAGRRLRPRQAVPGLATLARSLREVAPERFRLAVLRTYLAGSLKQARSWLRALARA
ncbi:MAG: adenylyltransferase/cytidyltransferase family protein [Planctomycetia bacterium]